MLSVSLDAMCVGIDMVDYELKLDRGTKKKHPFRQKKCITI